MQTAQLRVENATLLKKASIATHIAKRFEEENKQLLKKVEKLSQEIEARISRPLTSVFTDADECTSSQQTTCASSCEMVNHYYGGFSLDTSLPSYTRLACHGVIVQTVCNASSLI